MDAEIKVVDNFSGETLEWELEVQEANGPAVLGAIVRQLCKDNGNTYDAERPNWRLLSFVEAFPRQYTIAFCTVNQGPVPDVFAGLVHID